LSALLGQFGLSERLALELGSLSYLAMTVLGVWTAGRLVRPLQNAGVLVLAAPAFALFGGVYVHVHQMAVALPLGLLLLSRWRSQRLAAALTLAIVVLAVPWQTLVEYGLIAAPPPAASRANAEAEMSRVGADDRLAEDVWAVWVRSGVHDGRTRLEQAAVKLPTWLSLGSILAFAVSLAARRQRKVTAPEPRPLVVAG
jgi:hypothetical protein